MEFSVAERVLLDLLKISGVSKNNIIGVMLVLRGKEELMKEFAVWIYDNQPTENEVMLELKKIISYLGIPKPSRSTEQI